MILIAATAAGFGAIRRVRSLNLVFFFTNPNDVSPSLWLNEPRILINCVVGSLPIVMAWTFALVAMRMMRPRPMARRVARQPGLVAGVTACALISVNCLSLMFLIKNPMFALYLHNMHYTAPFQIGAAVAGAWALLKWGGGWHPEPHWIDRAGRVVGIFWVVWGAISCFMPWLVPNN